MKVWVASRQQEETSPTSVKSFEIQSTSGCSGVVTHLSGLPGAFLTIVPVLYSLDEFSHSRCYVFPDRHVSLRSNSFQRPGDTAFSKSTIEQNSTNDALELDLLPESDLKRLKASRSARRESKERERVRPSMMPLDRRQGVSMVGG